MSTQGDAQAVLNPYHFVPLAYECPGIVCLFSIVHYIMLAIWNESDMRSDA